MRTAPPVNRRDIRDPSGSNSRIRIRLAGLVLAWMFLLGMIGAGLVGPNRSSIEREFRIDHAQFGVAFAAIQIVSAGLALGVSLRFRRFDALRALIGGLLLQALGFTVIACCHTKTGLVTGWSLATFGTNLATIANMISARLWSHDPYRGVTLLHGLNGLGKVAGPLLAVLCFSIGWRWSFLVTGAAAFAIGALFLTGDSQFRPFVPPASTSPVRFRELTRPLFLLCVVSFGLLTGGNVAFAALVPLYYETKFGLSATASGLLLGIHLAGVASGRFLAISLKKRLSDRVLLLLCLIAGLAVFPALRFHSWIVISAGLFGVGGMFSGPWPIFYTRASKFFASHLQLLDYGSAVGGALGIAACMYASSALAERSPDLAMLMGPVAVWVFGVFFFMSPLAKSGVEES